jgi:hypothetical protein
VEPRKEEEEEEEEEDNYFKQELVNNVPVHDDAMYQACTAVHVVLEYGQLS